MIKNNDNKSRNIFTFSDEYRLIISQEYGNLYVSSFESIIQELAENDILRAVYRNPENPSGFNQQIFTLNQLRYGYFRLPVEIRWEENGQTYSNRNLELLFRTDNLYLEGFIVTYHHGGHLPDTNIYYHFNFSLQTQRYRNQYGMGEAIILG